MSTWVIDGKHYTDSEAISAGLLTEKQMTAHRALQHAAERMGQTALRAYVAKHGPVKIPTYGVYRGVSPIQPTPEHREIVDAMPKVLDGRVSPEEAMSLLLQYGTLAQRTGTPDVRNY